MSMSSFENSMSYTFTTCAFFYLDVIYQELRGKNIMHRIKLIEGDRQ